MRLQKLGGYAAILLACLNIAFIGATSVAFSGPDNADEVVGMMAAYQASPAAFHFLYFEMALSGILILLVILALQERMQSKTPHLMRLAVIAASVCAALMLTASTTGLLRNTTLASTKDISAYRALLVVYDGLSSAANRALGCAFLLAGWAAIRTRTLPLMLSGILLVFGIEQIIELFMPNITASAGFILWWAIVSCRIVISIGLGVVLLRSQERYQSVGVLR